jgi:hypothetical protein
MCGRARIVPPGQTGTDPDGTEIPLFGGDVTLDANAEVRGSIDISTSSQYWPTDSSSLATPYGNELFVERGVVLGTGTRELVSQGYYRIDTVEQDAIPGQIRIAGKDRMAAVVDGKLLAPLQFTTSTTLQTVVETLVLDVLPDATFDMDSDFSSATLGRQVIAEEDRFQFLLDAVRSHGKIWYWDHTGALRITEPPDPASPVFDVDHGGTGVLVGLRRSVSRDGMYNIVVATGEAPDSNTPVRATAFDADVSSPTYWLGQFGKVPRFYSSPFITEGGQAKLAAETLLRRVLGLPYRVDFQTVPNPALEPEDPIRLVSPQDSRVHIIDRLTLPLTNDGNPVTATTRQQTEPHIQFLGG